MFDKQSIEAYRNIKAPEELREKVMRLNPELSSPGSNHRSKNAMLRPIAAVACAAVFCLAVSFSFWNQKDAALLYQGVPVEGEPAVIAADMPQSAALVRDSVPSGIPLELETAERTKVSVSGGELSAFDAEGMLLGSGREVELSGKAALYWDLSQSDNSDLLLVLATEAERFTYTLSVSGSGGYILQKKRDTIIIKMIGECRYEKNVYLSCRNGNGNFFGWVRRPKRCAERRLSS